MSGQSQHRFAHAPTRSLLLCTHTLSNIKTTAKIAVDDTTMMMVEQPTDSLLVAVINAFKSARITN